MSNIANLLQNLAESALISYSSVLGILFLCFWITIVVTKKITHLELTQKYHGKEIHDLHKKIDKLSDDMQKGFDKIDKRFEKIDERFEKIDERFEKIDERFEKIDERFEKIDERFEKMNGNIVEIKEKMADLKTDVRVLQNTRPLTSMGYPRHRQNSKQKRKSPNLAS